MENQNLNQYQGQKDNEVKIGITRDGRSLTFKVPEDNRIFFKAVAYVEKVIESARKRQANIASTAGQIKG